MRGADLSRQGPKVKRLACQGIDLIGVQLSGTYRDERLMATGPEDQPDFGNVVSSYSLTSVNSTLTPSETP